MQSAMDTQQEPEPKPEEEQASAEANADGCQCEKCVDLKPLHEVGLGARNVAVYNVPRESSFSFSNLPDPAVGRPRPSPAQGAQFRSVQVPRRVPQARIKRVHKQKKTLNKTTTCVLALSTPFNPAEQ